MTVIVAPASQSLDLAALKRREAWIARARPKQLFPEDENWWNIGLLLAGRGFGKTRPLAEDLWWHCYRFPNFIYHVVARTDDDLRVTCYEGESGLRAVCPPELLYKGSWDKAYNASLQEVTFSNGSKCLGFAAKVPGQLRGPQCHRLWGDEFAAWEENGPGKAKETLDNALLGCRLPRPDGLPARALLSTTPRPLQVLRDLMKRDDIIVRTGSLYENIDNLSDNFKKTILPLEGTRIGDQEIHGKLLDIEDMGIIKRSWFPVRGAHKAYCKDAECPGCSTLPRFDYVLCSYDTALSEESRDKKKNETDPTACGWYGLFQPRPGMTHRALVLDCWDERLGYPDLKERVAKDKKMLFGPKEVQRRVDMILVERKGSGISLLQDLEKSVPELQSFNPRNMSKLTRLHLASPYVKHGMIWLPESEDRRRRGKPKTWLENMLNQVCSFSGEGSIEHDDHVDQFSQAVLAMSRLGFLQLPGIDKTLGDDVDSGQPAGHPYDQ